MAVYVSVRPSRDVLYFAFLLLFPAHAEKQRWRVGDAAVSGCGAGAGDHRPQAGRADPEQLRPPHRSRCVSVCVRERVGMCCGVCVCLTSSCINACSSLGTLFCVMVTACLCDCVCVLVPCAGIAFYSSWMLTLVVLGTTPAMMAAGVAMMRFVKGMSPAVCVCVWVVGWPHRGCVLSLLQCFSACVWLCRLARACPHIVRVCRLSP